MSAVLNALSLLAAGIIAEQHQHLCPGHGHLVYDELRFTFSVNEEVVKDAAVDPEIILAGLHCT